MDGVCQRVRAYHDVLDPETQPMSPGWPPIAPGYASYLGSKNVEIYATVVGAETQAGPRNSNPVRYE